MAAPRRQQRSWWPTLTVAAVALLGAPVAWIVNTGVKHAPPAAILVLAVLVLGGAVAFMRRLVPKQPAIFYAFALFAFTSVIDMLIPLEFDGWVHGFMDVYMQHGEPYLFSAWGALSAYWDGTFNLICYLYMSFCVSNGIPYRDTAIFYASNILNSMVVLLMGAFLSGTGLHWCTFLNIPYVLVPAYVLWKALESPQSKRKPLPLHCGLRDVSVTLLYLAAIFNIFRGTASLGSRVEAMTLYRQWVEPLMEQKVPAPFAAVQNIVCTFYFAPVFVVLAIAVTKDPQRRWLRDLSIVAAGAALQAEVCLVGMQWHPLTESQHHLPSDAGVFALALHVSAHALTLLAPALCAVSLSIEGGGGGTVKAPAAAPVKITNSPKQSSQQPTKRRKEKKPSPHS